MDKLNINNKVLKVAHFADIHFGIQGKDWHNDKEERTIKFLDYVVDKAKPDFIVCGGDNILTTGVDKLNEFIKLMDKYKTPWTFIFGNHDAESNQINYRKKDISEALEKSLSPYLIYKSGFIENDLENRYGNFSIPIYKNNKLVGAFILLDSGVYDYENKHYQAISKNQINWYKNEIDRLNKIYNDQKDNIYDVIPTINFSHIQLYKTSLIYQNAINNKNAKFIISQEINENIDEGGPNFDTNFYDVLKEKKSCKAYLVGHAHTYKFQVLQDGIIFGFAPQVGFSKLFLDNDLARNCYVYNVNEDMSFNTTNIIEDTSNIKLAYSGTYDGIASFNKLTNEYEIQVLFKKWNRIAFSFNGKRIKLNGIKILGLFNNDKKASFDKYLYTENDEILFYSGDEQLTYIFTFNEKCDVLKIKTK